MAFSQCFFFDAPEVTKIVLPKFLQNFKLYLFARELNQKGFYFYPRNTIQGETEGSPLSVLSALRLFFRIPQKGPKKGSIFWSFATEWMLKNPKGSPFQFFRHCEPLF